MGGITRYARSGDFHIAYLAAGEGPVDILYVPTWIGQVEVLGEEPTVASFIERVCEFARLIAFDRRGSGLSDAIVGAPTLEEQIDDALAVLDAVGVERAALMGSLEGGPMALMLAATHPERVSSLMLYSTFARMQWAPDYDWALRKEDRDAMVEGVLAQWGQGGMVRGLAPSRENDPEFITWAGKMERYGASPGFARQILTTMGEVDVRHLLPTIRVPTLVCHRTGDSFLRIEHSRYLAEHIPGARFVELPGSDSMFSVGEPEPLLGEMEEFLTGERHEREPDRVLATVLFTDIVKSTERAAELGDAAWRSLLGHHDTLVRREIERNRGRPVKSTGDGVLATFDGPARAIRAAASIEEGVRRLGIEIRAGLHTGECEVIGDDVGGLAVHIGARVMAKAGPGEVLVSSTVKDLVVGSGIDFAERGSHELKGIPGEWNLFAVSNGG